jgi:hypothetical protein
MQLYSRWSAARGRAAKARFEVIMALVSCACGGGQPPTRTQLDRVRRLEHDAETLRLTLDAAIFDMSGTASAALSPDARDYEAA